MSKSRKFARSPAACVVNPRGMPRAIVKRQISSDTSPAATRMTIFTDRDDYQRFLNLLRNVVRILNGMLELLSDAQPSRTLRPTLPNISAAVQQLNGRYASGGTGGTDALVTRSKADSRRRSSNAMDMRLRCAGT